MGMVQVLRSIWTCDGGDVRKHLTKSIFPALVAIQKAGEDRTIRCIRTYYVAVVQPMQPIVHWNATELRFLTSLSESIPL